MQHESPIAPAKFANVTQVFVTSLGFSWSPVVGQTRPDCGGSEGTGITHIADVNTAGVPATQAQARAGGNGAVFSSHPEAVLELPVVALVGRGKDAALDA